MYFCVNEEACNARFENRLLQDLSEAHLQGALSAGLAVVLCQQAHVRQILLFELCPQELEDLLSCLEAVHLR